MKLHGTESASSGAPITEFKSNARDALGRGGLVLLNDGAIRFIGTEEELKQLRWK
jgi:hypothetical protein